MALIGRIDYLLNTISYLDILQYYNKVKNIEYISTEAKNHVMLTWKDGVVSYIDFMSFMSLASKVQEFGHHTLKSQFKLREFLLGQTFKTHAVDFNYHSCYSTVCDRKYMNKLIRENNWVKNEVIDYEFKELLNKFGKGFISHY